MTLRSAAPKPVDKSIPRLVGKVALLFLNGQSQLSASGFFTSLDAFSMLEEGFVELFSEAPFPMLDSLLDVLLLAAAFFSFLDVQERHAFRKQDILARSRYVEKVRGAERYSKLRSCGRFEVRLCQKVAVERL
jgi:hypothetical protein